MWLVFAILSALSFGFRGVMYHWASKQGLPRNLMLFGVFFTGFIGSLLLALLYGQQWTAGTLIGILMGVFSYGANTAVFRGFQVGKASLIAILTALPPVVVVVLAFFLYNESLTGLQLASFGFILGGVVMVRYSNDLNFKNLQGAQWGLLAMLLFGLNDMASKWSTMILADMFPVLTYMFLVGSILFAAGWLLDRKNKKDSASTQPNAKKSAAARTWAQRNIFICGMLIGLLNFFGMVFIITAFGTGITGLVSAVVALNVFIILLYTRIFVKERFKKVELAGIIVAIAGIVLLRLFE